MKRACGLLFLVLLSGAGFLRCGGEASTPAPAAVRTWSAPERISDNVTDLHYPAVAVDNQGNAVAAWARGISGVIHANRLSATDGRWGGQEAIGSASDGGAWEPDLSVDATGRVVAVWYQMESPVNAYSRRFTPGTGWDDGPRALEVSPEDAYFPQVSLQASGNGIAIWEQGGSVLASRYDGGAGSWGAAVSLSAGFPGTAGLPGMPGRGKCVQVDGAGNARAVWKQADGGGIHIVTRRFDGAAWGAPERVDPAPGDSDDPALAVSGPGDAAVAWAQTGTGDSGDRSLLWVRRYPSGGGGDPPVLLDNVAGRSDKPQIGADRNGNLFAVWRRQEVPAGPRLLYGARFTPGGGWSAPFRLSERDAGGELWPALSVDAGGNAVVAWEQPETEGGASRIWATRFVSGGGWEKPAPVSLPGTGDADEPALGADASGNAVLIWKQKDTAESNAQSIWASRLR